MYKNLNMCDRWFHLIGPRNFDVTFLGPNLKSAVTHIQILTYYSTFIRTNGSQLQSVRDQHAIRCTATCNKLSPHAISCSLMHVECLYMHVECLSKDLQLWLKDLLHVECLSKDLQLQKICNQKGGFERDLLHVGCFSKDLFWKTPHLLFPPRCKIHTLISRVYSLLHVECLSIKSSNLNLIGLF